MKIVNRKNLLQDWIHFVSLTENTYLLKQMKEVQEIIKTTPNSFELGEILRRIL